MLNKILFGLSTGLRESYYSLFPDQGLLEKLENQLFFLTVQTCNICNANCTFCGYQYMEQKKQIMTDDVFKKAVHDFLNAGGTRILLSGAVGDPLMDPKIIERIKLCRSYPGIKSIEMVTNCINLDNVGVRSLLTSGMTEIYVSTTGFDQAMHQRIYRSNYYEKAKENILAILRENKALGRPVKIIICLRVDKPINYIFNLPGFEEVRKLTDSVSYNYYFDDWSGRIKAADLTGNMRLRPKSLLFFKNNNPCSLLYDRVAILPNGDISLCGCRELNGDSELIIGNINRLSLTEAYCSMYSKQIRKKWLTNKIIPDICRDCTNYSPRQFLMLSENRRLFRDNGNKINKNA